MTKKPAYIIIDGDGGAVSVFLCLNMLERLVYMNKKALIGMSGGVDSSLAAALLKEQGYDVTGATMLLWDDTEAAAMDARRVCEHIGIDFITRDFREKFRRDVVDYFTDEYINGRTPNPCIMCNKYMKFGSMLDYALENGFDCISTGHYARIVKNGELYELHASAADKKDQSYFLYNFNQHVLSHTVMPLGGYTKERCREEAAKRGLPVANKPDSQEICFVKNDDYARFIQEHTGYVPRSGDIFDTEGKKIGEHKGLIYYTIGQRKGIGAYGRPMFVMSIDPGSNSIVLGEKGMEFSSSLEAYDMNYISGIALKEPARLEVKIRYQAKRAAALVTPLSESEAKIEFDEPQRAITPGQAAVLYDGDRVVGGGRVK